MRHLKFENESNAIDWPKEDRREVHERSYLYLHTRNF
jgi:hypothetical protein